MVEDPTPSNEQDAKQESQAVQHDLTLKSLVSDFFQDFIELFYPELGKDVEWKDMSPAGTVTVRKLAIKSRKREKTERRMDLTMRVRSKAMGTGFLIHVEVQERTKDLKNFPSRMFNYCSRLLEAEKFKLPVFPIALLSFAEPREEQPSSYEFQCQGKQVLSFQYEVIQLNGLRWQDFASRPNPVAVALAAKMPIDDSERIHVSLVCLRALDRLQIRDDQKEDIAEFVETYIKLNQQEENELQSLLMEQSGQDEVIPMVTSWMRRGRAEGRVEGRAEGKAEEAVLLIRRQLARRFGSVPAAVSQSIEELPIEEAEQLAEDLLDFTSLEDLVGWLGQQQSKTDSSDS